MVEGLLMQSDAMDDELPSNRVETDDSTKNDDEDQEERLVQHTK